MAKVFGIHMIELAPGVTEKELAEFLIKEGRSVSLEGIEIHLLKGDKGDRVGQYVVLFLMDSVETRNRAYGPPGGPEPERSEAEKAVIAKYASLVSTSSWADYVVVGE